MTSPREWKRTIGGSDYEISTSSSKLNLDFIDTAFASKETYSAKPLPRDQTLALLSNSTTLGLYNPEQQIGLARLVTDTVTTAFLTDVFILPEYRAHGLGRWLVQCCGEVLEAMPALRRAMLMVGAEGVGREFYERELGVWDVAGETGAVCLTGRFF